jgi:hypothetical protein
MARADLLVHLVRAAKEPDEEELGGTVKSMIAEERGKQHYGACKSPLAGRVLGRRVLSPTTRSTATMREEPR